MDYSRAIEKRDCAKIDKLNSLVDIKTFWDDVGKHTRKITSDHSIARWQCLAEYRYKELSEIWNKLNEADKMVFRCAKPFYGMWKEERSGMFAKHIEIYPKNEMFILYNDKTTNNFGEVFYRINDAKSFFYDGMVLASSIVRAIDKGVLEEIKNFKFPEVKVYSLEEVLKVYSLEEVLNK